MPGTPDLRAQAKWQQKYAKNNPPPKNPKEDKNNLLIATRGRIREQELKSQKELCMKTLDINTLGHLRERYTPLRDSFRQIMADMMANRHMWVHPGYARGHVFHMQDDWSIAFKPIDKYVPYYKKGRELSDKEFRQRLDDEIKCEIETTRYKHLNHLQDSFDRTLDRTYLLKSDLLVIVNKFNCIRACKTIKEELVAVAWHPDRVWAWIRAGRYLGLVNGEPEHAYNVLNMMAGYDSD
jgi:hypothetical protein